MRIRAAYVLLLLAVVMAQICTSSSAVTTTTKKATTVKTTTTKAPKTTTTKAPKTTKATTTKPPKTTTTKKPVTTTTKKGVTTTTKVPVTTKPPVTTSQPLPTTSATGTTQAVTGTTQAVTGTTQAVTGTTQAVTGTTQAGTTQHPDFLLTVPEMIARRGYPVEVHTITTADGYILNVHRIANPGKPVVLIHHGLFGSSTDWVLMGPDKGLGYMAYNAGYDVWLANSRGTRYSNNHTTMDKKNFDYWQFSYHEMGVYDVPAEIDYILANTSQTQVNYVGHSMGTLQFWTFLSMKPEYNAKIRTMNAMAPVSFMGTPSNNFNTLKTFLQGSFFAANLLQWGEFLPYSPLNAMLATNCQQASNADACSNLFFSLLLAGSVQVNTTTIPLLLKHYPSGQATKSVQHIMQQIGTGKFSMYDYGWGDNLVKYNNIAPPEYPLNKITAPVFLHFADKDDAVTPGNVDQICAAISNCVSKRRVPFDEFRHGDFMIGMDANTLVYEAVMANIKNEVPTTTPAPSTGTTQHPDFLLTVPEMIARRGYPVEVHTITTADGYILNVHRIANPGKPVVLIHHGLFGSSTDWVLMGPDKGLGYIAYNAGYDVWLANSRGTRYSNKHTTMDKKNFDYWQFSYHEMGVYDVPAEIDYILANTSQTQVNYVGHSMGTLQFWTFLSMKPEYNAKIRTMNAMAPVSFMGTPSNNFNTLKTFLQGSFFAANLLQWGEFLPYSPLNAMLATNCQQASNADACSNLFFSLLLAGSVQVNTTTIPLLLKHYPSGQATKSVQHIMQQIGTGKFSMYDYGWGDNLVKYFNIAPPEYPLNKITAPVFLHFADKDDAVTPGNVDQICAAISNCKSKRRVPFDEFRHGDFMIGMDANTLVYEAVMANIRSG